MFDFSRVATIVPGVAGGWYDSDGSLIISFAEMSRRSRAIARLNRVVLPTSGLVSLDRKTGELRDMPPFGITGAKNTQPPQETPPPISSHCPVSVLVDFLSFVVRGDSPELLACHLVGAGQSWQDMPHGGHGYASCRRRGAVSVYYGGDKCGDTAFVQVSGQGCRQLEEEGLVGGDLLLTADVDRWQAFIGELIDNGATIKRLDFAIDDYSSVLNLDVIENHWDNGDVLTRIEKFDRRKEKNRKGDVTKDIIYLGSRESMMFVRIYNKHLEQLSKGVTDSPVDWIRFEVEIKQEKAHNVALGFVQYGFGFIPSVVRGLIDFKDPDDHDSNDCRRRAAPWWDQWLDSAARLRVLVAPSVRSVAKIAAWVESQVAPALHILAHLPQYGRSYLEKMIKQGGLRLSKSHLQLFDPEKVTKSVTREYIFA